MRFAGIFSKSVLAGFLMLLTGCSPEAQQSAPRLIVKGMAKLSGAKRGFFVTDGQPTYHDWNAGAGNIVKPLAGADASSFYVFQQPKESKALFARDRSHVYMADLFTPREIKGADAKSFDLITRDGLYSQDAKRVYYLGVPIVDADPLTFEVLTHPFSRDSAFAFIGAVPIPGVDRQSWRPLRKGRTDDYWYRSDRDTHPKNQESVSVAGWSRDANAFYYGREVVTGIDASTFEVLSDYYAKDRDHVYSRYFHGKLTVIKDADPATFVVHADADDILRGGRSADAHDAKSQYHCGKVFTPK